MARGIFRLGRHFWFLRLFLSKLDVAPEVLATVLSSEALY